MSQVSYESFLPEVLPYVRDCPEFVAINAIRNACIEFCNETLYLRQTLDNIPVVVGTSEYELDLPPDHMIAMVLEASLGRNSLMVESTDKLAQVYGTGWQLVEGMPQYVTQNTFESVILSPVPSTADVEPLIIKVALRPLRKSTKVERIIFERWAEVIGFGARARLHDTPGQPYSDPDAAKKFRGWFESGYGNAKIEANRSLVRSNLRVQMPRFV